MLCFGSPKTPRQNEAERKSKEIDKTIKRSRQGQPLRLLLLGTGDSGKSTFAKQMMILHGKEGSGIGGSGFSEATLQSFVPVLRDNALKSIKILLIACRNWNIDLGPDLQPIAERLLAVDTLTPEVVETLVKPVWESAAVQKTFEQRNRIQLPGGASTNDYYLDNAARFAKEDYLPTSDDVLRAKQKTINVLETNFEASGTNFVMIDVGGQRSERKKWLSCFSDVSAVIYLVAMNEYDMLMEEDGLTNRMEESLKLFQKLSGSQWLREVSFILFLNKSDLLREKVKTRPLSRFFEDYEEFSKGDDGFEKSCEYIKAQYVRVFNGVRLYTFITNALDTENCDRVFLSVRDTVMNIAFDNHF